MRKDNLKAMKTVFMIIIFVVLLVIFFSLLFATKDNRLIRDIKEYINKDTKILYIADKENYLDYPTDIFTKYDLNYMYINSSNLSNIEKSKLEKIINSKYLTNIIVVFNNGEIKDAIIEYESEEKLEKFLKKNKLIPEVIGDNSKIFSSVESMLNEDYAILYIPYEYSNDIKKQDKILNEIASEYEINYKRIDAYLLSNQQHDKLNIILQISSVDNQIIILIKDKKIIGSIRDLSNKETYLNKLKEYSFIDEIDSYITYINYSKFNNLLNNDNKNIIVFGKDDCKYCEDVIKTLNTIAINYDVEINYLNIGNIDTTVYKDVEKKLDSLGYKDGFTTPLTIIVENNKLIDYAIGPSNEDYFVDIFTENGIIK